MEKLLVTDREILRPIVVAMLERNNKNACENQARFNEILGNHVDGEQAELGQIVMVRAVNPCMDYLLGATTYDDYINTVIELAITATKDRMTFLENIKEDALRAIVNEIVQGFISNSTDTDPEIKTINTAIQIAQSHGITPVDVFSNDELYTELVRSLYTPESFREISQRVFGNFLDEKNLLENLMQPIVQSYATSEGMNDEEIKEIKEYMEKELFANPDFQTEMARMRNAANQLLDELVQKYFK